MATNLVLGDYISLSIYFILVIGFGIWSSCKNRGSVQGYFLAGRSMHWIPVGASHICEQYWFRSFYRVSCGAASGVGVAGYEVFVPPAILVLGWYFLPVYLRSGVYTMPEYLKKRFGGDRIRISLSIISLVAYVLTKISVDLFSGALFLKLSLDLNLYSSLGILILISAVFTIGGGLTAVVWTDFIQTIIMLIGALYLMATSDSIFSITKDWRFSQMKLHYGYSIANTLLFSNSTCGIPPKDYLNIVRDTNSDLPWPGMVFGLFIMAVWYFCTDQVIVQRALAAKSLNHAKAGCILAGALKLLPLFLMVYPGMIARILYKDDVMCADPVVCKEFCGNPYGCSNVAYPRMVIDLMPAGARGLMLAVMMAALMSSLTSVFNSSSTIFTMDIYKRFRVQAKDWELMVVGRLFVVVLLVFSILAIPIIQSSKDSKLFDYINGIQSFMSPPICGLFVMAVTFKRVNESGAFWGLIIGLVVGLIKFIWLSSYEVPYCGMDTKNIKFPPPLVNMHFLNFAIIIFVVTCLNIWFISLMTKPIPEKYIRSLVYSTMNDMREPIEIPSNKGCGSSGFCAAAATSDLDEADVEEEKEEEKNKLDLKVNEELKVEVITNSSVFKRILFFACGIEKNASNQKSELNSYNKHDFNQGSPFWSKVCNISAVGLLMLTGFMSAFLNKYN